MNRILLVILAALVLAAAPGCTEKQPRTAGTGGPGQPDKPAKPDLPEEPKVNPALLDPNSEAMNQTMPWRNERSTWALYLSPMPSRITSPNQL